MPTLNEYADEDGYYILARPSDTGNITYQLKPRGEQIVEKVGYHDGDNIGWQVISALKIPNLIYTGEEGQTDDDISVDISEKEIDALSEEDAEQLLDELSSVPRVGDSQTEEIKEILEVSDRVEFQLETLVGEIESKIREQGIVDERPLERSQTTGTLSVNFFTGYKDVRDEKPVVTAGGAQAHFVVKLLGDIKEEFKNDTLSDNPGFFDLTIYLSQTYGIVSWNVDIDTTSITSSGMIECGCILNDMLPVVISKTEDSGIEVI